LLRSVRNDEVQNKKGIYKYVLLGEDLPALLASKYLNLRAFSDAEKIAKYESQNGICPVCKKHFNYDEMAGDHIVPWSRGGKTTPDNLQMLCRQCNGTKNNQ